MRVFDIRCLDAHVIERAIRSLVILRRRQVGEGYPCYIRKNLHLAHLLSLDQRCEDKEKDGSRAGPGDRRKQLRTR